MLDDLRTLHLLDLMRLNFNGKLARSDTFLKEWKAPGQFQGDMRVS
jgi:hypothetical protein